MIIGFTGTKKGMTKYQKDKVRSTLEECYEISGTNIFHHGDCIGADAEAHDIAADIGYYIVIHPPKDPKARAFKTAFQYQMMLPKPYLDRNRDIVDSCQLLIATPDGPEVLRSGTWSTIRYANKVRTCRIVIHLSPFSI